MTLDELKTRLEAEKHCTGPLEIACGEKRETPYTLGVYEEEGHWYIYNTDGQGRIVVLDNGREEDMTEAFYPFFDRENPDPTLVGRGFLGQKKDKKSPV